jgi:O-glycosyl hydrolase
MSFVMPTRLHLFPSRCRWFLQLGLLGLAGYAAGRLSAATTPELITVRHELRHQTLQGFGASIIGWQPPMEKYFTDPVFADKVANELGMSVFRVQMWDGMLPTEVTDWREIDRNQFDWDAPDARRGLLNVQWARMMVAANPEVKIIGSVWSAPGWMKVSGKRAGSKAGYLFSSKRDYDHDNRLRADRHEHFAKWIVEFCRYMEEQGTPFYAISLQNEPLFTEWYESTMFEPDEYARLMQVTGEMFEREGVRRPLFYGPEDMTVATYNDRDRHRPYVDALLQSPAARYFDAFATHGYSDGVNPDGRHNAGEYWKSIKGFGRPYWITEGGSGEHQWPGPVTTGIGPRLHAALVQANVSLFTAWQVNGESGKSGDHHIMVDGVMTPKSYATMHFWRHLRPGTVRVEVVPPVDAALMVSAYVDDARQRAITILINTGPEPRELLLNWGQSGPKDWKGWLTSAAHSHEVFPVTVERSMARFTLPGHSIVTTEAQWERAGVGPAIDPRWEGEIAAIERREAGHAVPEGGILFAGSSSIRLWQTLAVDFPGQPVYQRGFGGSQLADLVGYFDRVILPALPRRIIVYAGTNDLNSGRSPEQVLADLDRFCGLVAQKLPGTTVAFIGAAPNPRRWPLREAYQRFNAMAAVYCRQNGHDFIDVWPLMLGADGLPSRDLYRDDQLHMNAAGYALWGEIVAPWLVKRAGR